MLGEAVGNSQNQGVEVNNEFAVDWEQAMQGELQKQLGQVESKGGSEKLEAWLETVKGTPEEYWQRLAEEKRENGVELGEMPDLAKTDEAIQHFFENGVNGVAGAAREVREAMTKKAILGDIAKLKERGGELNDETMRNVFYGTQRMLEEMYRGNRELREDAREEELSPDEEVAWHLKMEPGQARMNVLIALQKQTRRAGEGSDAYEARLRNYVEDTPAHREQLEADQAYNAEHPDEAAEYAAQVLKNGQRDDLPEYKYLGWEAKAETGEREGRIRRLFEKARGRIGFRNVVNKVKKKLAGAVLGAVKWAEGVLAEETNEENTGAVGEDEGAEEEVAGGSVEEGGEETGEGEQAEVSEQVETEAETGEQAEEMDRSERLRQLGFAKAEVERRVHTATDNAAQEHWMILAKEIDDKIIQLRVDEERDRRAAEEAFQPYEAVDFAGKFGIEKLKTDGVIPADEEITLEGLQKLQSEVEAKILEAAYARDSIAENHYRSQLEFIQMAVRGMVHEQMTAAEQATGQTEADATEALAGEQAA